MDDPEILHGDESEENVCDSFQCCVCLDLLYKPIVLSCGHISCFWCVNRSMNNNRLSSCPLCRHPYIHFPTICQMLHFLLLKKYPVAYKRRELQILEEEKRNGLFSPQFDAHACSSRANQDSNVLANSAYGESCANVKKIESVSHIPDNGTAVSKNIHGRDSEGIENVTDEEKNSLGNKDSRSCQQISVADVLCAACKQLLFHPVVLNCGHVYCESCIINPNEEMLKCQVCPSSHPTGFPKVCLELGHFLEEQFPKEYALRREDVQLKQAVIKHENPAACATKDGMQGKKLSQWSDPPLGIHRGFGCDFCGIFPIIGDRYSCVDCVEKVGFDLCSDCYNSKSKLPGRFNQQHTPEHKFRLIHRTPIGPAHLLSALADGWEEARRYGSGAAIAAFAAATAAARGTSTTGGDEQDDSLPPAST